MQEYLRRQQVSAMAVAGAPNGHLQFAVPLSHVGSSYNALPGMAAPSASPFTQTQTRKDNESMRESFRALFPPSVNISFASPSSASAIPATVMGAGAPISQETALWTDQGFFAKQPVSPLFNPSSPWGPPSNTQKRQPSPAPSLPHHHQQDPTQKHQTTTIWGTSNLAATLQPQAPLHGQPSSSLSEALEQRQHTQPKLQQLSHLGLPLPTPQQTQPPSKQPTKIQTQPSIKPTNIR